MEIVNAILAEVAEVDDEGRIEIGGICRIISTPIVPHFQPLLSLMLTYRAGPGEKGALKEVSLHVVDQDGREIAPPRRHPVIVREDTPQLEPEADQVIDLLGLTFPDYGRYYFDILINGDSKRRLEMFVCPSLPRYAM